MKRFLCAVIFAVVGFLGFSQERIAVFPFEDRGNVLNRDEAIMFYSEFTNAFTNRSRDIFSVVPRMDVERLINTETAFQLSDYSSRAKTAEWNRVLNGTQILSGLIGRVNNDIRVTVSLYTFPDLNQLPGGATIVASNKNELFNKIPELVQKMLAEIIETGQTALSNTVGNLEVYTIYYSGLSEGLVVITKEPSGKITIIPNMKKNQGDFLNLDHRICPLLYGIHFYDANGLSDGTTLVTIEGNTTTENIYGRLYRTIVDGNITTKTSPWGEKIEIVVDGNTTTETSSTGCSNITIVNGNVTTKSSSDGWGHITVVNGNITTLTDFDHNIVWTETVVDKNTTLVTWPDGRWRRTVVIGNTTTVSDSTGSWEKEVVDRQGNDIYIFTARNK